MVGAESSDELGLMKDKFESSKLKETGNSGDIIWNMEMETVAMIKGAIEFFHCDGSYMMWDCLKKSTFSAIRCNDELDRASMRIDSIVHSVEAKRIRENEKKLVKCSNR
ncbi:hypothetical protein Godav_027907, partial [Gossypium davidsonii]|nr:hypothetical protein [Gossypium davidsonii]